MIYIGVEKAVANVHTLGELIIKVCQINLLFYLLNSIYMVNIGRF